VTYSPEKDGEVVKQGVNRERTAVRELGLPVIPDLFVGVELRGVGGEAFDVKPWMTLEKTIEGRAAMNASAIPEQNNVTAQMTQQQLEEGSDLEMANVGEVEVAVKTEALPARADGHGGDGRDLVVLLSVIKERRPSARRPGSAHRRDQHEAALVEKSQVRAQPADFFLISAQR